MMRSGTLWLQRMLSRHPDIVDIPTETHLFEWLSPFADHVQHATAATPHVGAVFMGWDAYVHSLRALCDTIFDGYANELGVTTELLLERTPQHVNDLELIGTLYPDAAVIHIIRDGRDVVRSLVNQHFGPETIPEAARQWRTAVLSARAAGARLGGYTEVRYEELLADPGTGVKRLFERLGLEATDDAVKAAVAEAAIPANVDPDFPDLRGGKWAAEWSARQEAAFAHEAGDLLVELGYEQLPASALRPSTLARARRRWGLRRHGTLPRFQRMLMRTQNQTAQIFETLLEDVELQRFDRLNDVVLADARIKVWTPGASWEDRGVQARERLARVLAEDVPTRGDHVRTEIHTAVPAAMCVSEYRRPDGRVTSRVLAVTIEGAVVTQLSYYVLNG